MVGTIRTAWAISMRMDGTGRFCSYDSDPRYLAIERLPTGLLYVFRRAVSGWKSSYSSIPDTDMAFWHLLTKMCTEPRSLAYVHGGPVDITKPHSMFSLLLERSAVGDFKTRNSGGRSPFWNWNSRQSQVFAKYCRVFGLQAVWRRIFYKHHSTTSKKRSLKTAAQSSRQQEIIYLERRCCRSATLASEWALHDRVLQVCRKFQQLQVLASRGLAFKNGE